MSEVTMGTLYEINKSAMEQEKNMSSYAIREALKEIARPYVSNSQNKYFMLLCNERRDYTLFHKKNNSHKTYENMLDVLKECLTNRGRVKSIELDKVSQAIEIWLHIDEENFAYYLFPYDTGVIECEV